MYKPLFAGVLLAVSLLWLPACRDSRADPRSADTAGLWIGTSHITASRSTIDLGTSYTMQSDFWFRVDADGKVKGNAYVVYHPTFDAAGMNTKITLAKSILSGALSLLPGGQLAVVKSVIDAGKVGTNVSLAGLVGVVTKYADPRPIRSGAITGSLRGGKLALSWVEPQPAGIPATVSLQYIDRLEPIAHPTLRTQEPWYKPAAIDPGSGGRFAIAQDQTQATKDGVTESMFAYWSATHVE